MHALGVRKVSLPSLGDLFVGVRTRSRQSMVVKLSTFIVFLRCVFFISKLAILKHVYIISKLAILKHVYIHIKREGEGDGVKPLSIYVHVQI